MFDLNRVHPLREGNGACKAPSCALRRRKPGHKLDFSIVSRERMIQAGIAGNENGDASTMRRLFDEITIR